MAENTGTALVKQEIEVSCCSPSPSTGNIAQSILYSPQDNRVIKEINLIDDLPSFISMYYQKQPKLPGLFDKNQLEYKCNIQEPHPSPGSPDRQFCSSTTSAPGDMCSDSISLDTVKEELPRRLCLVCGDIASGFHYGVASCEACKAFFKRTIQGSIEYTCPANNECEINKRRRKACQACRFQKCLLMGMLKEGVRLDRVRGGRQKYRRNPISNPYQLQIIQSNPSMTLTSLDDIKILEMLSSFEPEIISVNHCGIDLMNRNVDEKSCIGESTIDFAQEILSVLADIYDKELVSVIGWAKQIPGFTDLPLNDQMKLLQVTWTELLTLQLSHRSIPFTGRLNFATDFWLDEKTAKECDAVDLYNHFAQITQRLEKLSITKEEYYLLKALVLSNCDVRLDNIGALRKIRDSILNAVNDCVILIRHNTAISQQQQLLLLLPSLRQADPIIRKFWINVHQKGDITMNKLFVEMLESVSR